MKNDYEFLPPSNLPDWLKNFADKELKKGGNPFEEIKNIFKQKDDLESVEAKVQELRDRIGLDKLNKVAEDKVRGGFGDNQPDKNFDSEQLNKGMKVELEHTNKPNVAKEIAKDHLQESKDFKGEKGGKYYDKLEDLEDEVKDELTKSEKVKAKMLINLVSISNILEDSGNLLSSRLIRKSIQKIAEDPKVFKKYEGIKKHIDNVCQSRKGYIDVPALVDIINSRPEKLTDSEMEEVREYIEKRIKEEKEEIKDDRDDDVIGLMEVHMFTIDEEDDGNSEVFSKPAKV